MERRTPPVKFGRSLEGLPRRRFTVADLEAMVAARILEDVKVPLVDPLDSNDCYIYQHKGAKVARRSQDHTFDALLEQNDVEVDQKTEPAPRQSKIRQQLRLMNRRQCVNRFHLDDHGAVHHQIDAIPGPELDS
jgi:hypothetical protein